MSWRGDGDQSFPPRVLNKSQLFLMNLPPTFLWKWPPQKPKFNDVCVLFKHSNFCSRVPEIHSKRPRFKHFCHGPCPQTPLVTCTFSTCKLPLWCKFFFFLLCLLQSFCHLLKTLLTTQFSNLLPGGMSPDPPSNLHLHFRRLQVAPVVQVFFPSLPTPKLLPPT